MDFKKLKGYIANSRFCSTTEKCAVACATDDLGRAGFCDTLNNAWMRLDNKQQFVVNEYRKSLGLKLFGKNGLKCQLYAKNPR